MDWDLRGNLGGEELFTLVQAFERLASDRRKLIHSVDAIAFPDIHDPRRSEVFRLMHQALSSAFIAGRTSIAHHPDE